MTTKRFTFSSGHPKDPTPGMTLVVDRTKLPPAMKLGLWLDDDGTEMTGVQRIRKHRATGQRTDKQCSTRYVLLDRARVLTTMGCASGVLTLEPGTRFEAGGPSDDTPIRVKGGAIGIREGRRFAEIQDRIAEVQVDRQPGEVHVFTLEAEKPVGARPDVEYFVEVTQMLPGGTVAGAVAVTFVFED